MEKNSNYKRKRNRKNPKRIIIIVILVLLTLIAGVAFAINYEFNTKFRKDFETIDASGKDSEKWKDSDVLNVLVLGLEDVRTDMIMVVSYNPKRNDINIISVPRDSFIENSHRDGGLHKINSLYGYPDTKDGVKRIASEVSKILGIPINQYVLVDYDAVRKIVDAVGGVEINIPFNMYYDDPTSKPPLHVYFEKGPTTVMGDQAVEYLRWRKNSDGSRGEEGDIGRINRQQDFVKKALQKALQPSKIQDVIKAIFDNVETSLNLSDIIALAKNASGMEKDKINSYSSVGMAYRDWNFSGPGYSYLWFFENETEKNHDLMEKILDGSIITDEDLSPSKSFIQIVSQKDVSGESRSGSSYHKNNNVKDEENPVGTLTTKPSTTETLDDVLFENTDDQNNENPDNSNNENTTQPNAQDGAVFETPGNNNTGDTGNINPEPKPAENPVTTPENPNPNNEENGTEAPIF